MNLSQFNRILMQTLLLPVLALAFVAGILGWQIHRAHVTVTAIQLSDENIAAATRLEKFMVDQETGLRGYQVTGDPQFLEPFRKSEAPFTATLAQLRRNVAPRGDGTPLIDAIEEAHSTWVISYAQPLIATIQAGGVTTDVTLNLQGKRQMDTIRSRIADLLDREASVRGQEASRWRKQSSHTVIFVILLALAAGSLISWFSVSRLHRVSDAYQGTLEGLRRHAQSTFESEERLRTTLTSIGDGVIVCDPDGRVEMLNTVAEELTLWKQSEAHHKPLTDVFHIVNETTRELVETPVAKVKRLNRVVGLANHTILIRRDGTEIPIDDSGAPIFDRSGKLSGIVMVFRDITEQKQTQTALLATEKLATAGRLAATIAHEIHNPLDSVVNLLYLLSTEKDPAVSANYLDLAQQELSRMGQISRAMLGLYRESKTPVRIDIKEMLESVLVLMDRQIKQAQVTLTTDLPEGLEIDGFPAELRQVCTNLIANATEAASPNGAISITAQRISPLTAAPSVHGIRRGIAISFRDNGPGIQPEALAHVFEPFFTTKGENGTGLGLWVCRGILDKHNGFVDIATSTAPEDHGTTLIVTLPAK